jgi:hypothetical protein
MAEDGDLVGLLQKLRLTGIFFFFCKPLSYHYFIIQWKLLNVITDNVIIRLILSKRPDLLIQSGNQKLSLKIRLLLKVLL